MRTLITSLSSEHLFLGGGYMSAGFIGHENPYVMGVAYMLVGAVHCGHVVRTRKSQAREDNED